MVSLDFLSTTHGTEATCIDCHKGVPAAEKDTAHTGLVADPSADTTLCGSCHEEIAAEYPTALHYTLQGYWTVLDARSVPENHPQLEEMFGNHCAKCHTSCGGCHISQPASVGGGLLKGHIAEKTPPMTRTCTACHGTRVGNEYLGKNEGIPGDVHFRQARMNCISCHNAANLHTSPGDMALHRYEGAESPACTDCHAIVGGMEDDNPQHVLHKDKLTCQVCHSVAYSSCDNCHVAISDKTGNPFFTTDATYLTFYIGLNPRQSRDRPYEYVTLRHVPISPTSFSYYGEDLLPNFNLLPNWVYSTPHNIQKQTPQNASCNSCHGNAALFLTADKVKPEELEANQAVIVPVVPPEIPVP